MAGVDDVEAAVAVDDRLAGGAGGGPVIQQRRQIDNLSRGNGTIARGAHAEIIGRSLANPSRSCLNTAQSKTPSSP